MSTEPKAVERKESEAVPAAPMVSTPDLPDHRRDQPRCTFEAKRYNGEQNWEIYLQHFNRSFNLNRWPAQMRSDYLLYLLDGEALAYVEALPPHRKETFEELALAMEERFGDSLLTKVHKAELRTRGRKPGESLPQLAQALQQLSIRAYPNLDWAP